MDESCVYWIRLKNHTDIFSEGYVGITSRPLKVRWTQHKSEARRRNKNYPLYNAINKYGDEVIIEKILSADINYCRHIENNLRPLPNIGWNLSIGGQVSPMLGRKHSPEVIDRLTEISRSRTKDCKDYCKTYLVKTKLGEKPWLVPASKEAVWVLAKDIYDYLILNPNHGCTRVSRRFGFENKYSTSVILKYIKSGWNPTQDQEWSEWVKDKLINKRNHTNDY